MTLTKSWLQGANATRRRSRQHYGLVLELRGQRLTFRHGIAWETYMLKSGGAELVACSRRGFARYELFDHVRGVAQAYAEALHR